MITSKIESQGDKYTRNIQKILEFPFLENSITNSYVKRKIDKSFSREEGSMESSSAGGGRGGGCVDGVNVRSQGARGRVISCESVNDT